MRQLKIQHRITDRSGMMERYVKELANVEILSAEEEAEVAYAAKAGDMQARERLILSASRFVVSVAKQYDHGSLSLADLINEGNKGLIMCIEKYDPARGFKFVSYAVWWIRQSILRYVKEQSNLIRLPANASADLNRLNRYVEKHYAGTGVKLSVAEAAEELSVNDELLKDAIISQSLVSCSKQVGDDEGLTVGDNLRVDDEQASDPAFTENLLREILNDKRTSDVIIDSYGINRPQPVDLALISARLNLSRERVRQIRDKGIQKLITKSKTDKRVREQLINALT